MDKTLTVFFSGRVLRRPLPGDSIEVIATELPVGRLPAAAPRPLDAVPETTLRARTIAATETVTTILAIAVTAATDLAALNIGESNHNETIRSPRAKLTVSASVTATVTPRTSAMIVTAARMAPTATIERVLWTAPRLFTTTWTSPSDHTIGSSFHQHNHRVFSGLHRVVRMPIIARDFLVCFVS